MKKLSHIIKGEKAFYLPFVVMIAMIILSAIATTVMIYRNELHMTKHVIDQLEAETIIQMSRKEFLETKAYHENDSGMLVYEYPVGTVTMQYERIAENKYMSELIITTNEQFILETVILLVVESD